MDREQAKQRVPIIQAFADGEDIQFDSLDGWVDITGPEFSQPAKRYRIKPKPREFWALPREMIALDDDDCARPGSNWIKVREIL